MLKQKISRIMSLLSAAVMMTALPVSAGAENIDVSKVDSTINVRVNKPYLNFVIKNNSGLNSIEFTDLKLALKNSSGKTVAEFSDKDSIKKIYDDRMYDFSDYHAPEDLTYFPINEKYADIYDVFTPDKYKGRAPSGMLYNKSGGGITDENGNVYIRPSDEYYYIYNDKDKLKILDRMTVPANTVRVMNDKNHVTLKDTTTFFYLKPESSSALRSDCPSGKPYKLYEHGGEMTDLRADAGSYHVCVNGCISGGNCCVVPKTSVEYYKVKMKFNDAFPGIAKSDLTIDYYYQNEKLKFDLRGDQSKNCFSAMYVSGSVLSSPIPDKDGYVEFWVSSQTLSAYIEYDFTVKSKFSSGGGGGSAVVAKFPKKVEKINSIFEFPQSGLCLYNIKPDTYTLKITSPALARDYIVKDAKITVTDTKKIQKATFTIEKRPLLLGDCNRDGAIDVTDVSILSAHVKGIKKLEGRNLTVADINEDKKVNITDVGMLTAHVCCRKRIAKKYV